MTEGINITIEPIGSVAKGLSPRLEYPLRDVPNDQSRGKSLKQIYIEKKQRNPSHG